MAIVVTGAAGFVGTALVRRLVGSGRSVVALDRTAGELTEQPGLRLVIGDIGRAEIRAEALRGRVDGIVHLATVPGGAAEADPTESKRINVDAMHDLLTEAASTGGPRLRFVFASSIAVFGDPLPSEGVNDGTILAPRLIYGGHKAMMETAVGMLHRRHAIEGVTVRLSGILARPSGASGMKSAFMSDVFHAMRRHAPFVAPVSPDATLWVQSVERCVSNLVHALDADMSALPTTRAVTLPAVRTTMRDLVAEIARQTGSDMTSVTYALDEGLERAFGRHPMLATEAAERAGFEGDGTLEKLVASALDAIASSPSSELSSGNALPRP